MSDVSITSSTGFNTSNFWVSNLGQSVNERFEGQTSVSGIGLERTLTYDSFVFESGGLTYRYTGNWTVHVDNSGILTSTVTASGSYTSVDVSSGSDVIASVSGLSAESVDFGSQTGGLISLVTNILDGVLGLLFGSTSDTTAYANLHTGATPNLPALAFAGIDHLNGGSGSDTISGYDGSDVITGGGGNDVLDGGSGTDIAVYNGSITNVTKVGSTITVTTATEGTDTLTGFEGINVGGVILGQWLNADTYSGAEDGPAVAVNLLANDVDFAGGAVALTHIALGGTVYTLSDLALDGSGNYTITAAGVGTLTINALGVGTFKSAADVNGAIHIGYATSGVDGAGTNGLATINLLPVNDLPVVSVPIPNQTINENGQWTFQVPTTTFTDADSDPLTYTATLADGSPLPSWLTFNPVTHTFSGSPGDVNGSLALKVTASDGLGSVSANFTLNITPENDAPTASPLPEHASANEDTAIHGQLLAGADVDGDALTYLLVPGSAQHGTVTINATTGEYTFTPAADYFGPAEFQYVVSDGTAQSAVKTVTLTFNSVNDAPIVAVPIADQSFAADQTATFTIPTGTFTDVDSPTLTYTAMLSDGSVLPSWLVFNASTHTFTATPPFVGQKTLSISVTASDGIASVSDIFHFTVGNEPPSSLALSTHTINENSAANTVVGTLSALDPDGSSLSYQLLDDAGGRFTLSGDKIVVANGSLLDFEQAEHHNVTVRVTDDGGAHIDKTFVIDVLNVEPESVSGGNGQDTISTGDGDATINGGGGDDVIHTGGGNDIIQGGDGNDTIDAGGGNDTVQGNDGNDYLIGGPGNDILDGGAGNDTIDGGTGNDQLIGGIGNDIILAVGRDDNDTVNAGDGDDTVYVDLTHTSGAAHVSTVTLGSGHDRVVIDMALPVTTVTNTLDLTDFQAGAGGDVIDLSPLLARLSGVTSSTDLFAAGYLHLVDTGSGTLLQIDVNGGGDSFVTLADIEGVRPNQLTSSNFNFTLPGSTPEPGPGGGGSGGGGEGGGLTGGNGPNTIQGGDGRDLVDYSNEGGPYGVSVNLTTGIAIDTFGSTDTLISIEDVRGTNLNDLLIGNEKQNALYGLAGNDTIYGVGDADSLFGDDGNDLISGDAGADTIHGGSGNDTIFGGNDNDQIFGEAGDNQIFGGLGKDLIYGGIGKDLIKGESGNDTIRGDAGNDTISGGAGKDHLYGDAGKDTIKGDAGNDTIYGGLGKDKLTGGAGRDVFAFDKALGGNNVDTITDFNPSADAIWLSHKVFHGVSKGVLPEAAFAYGHFATSLETRVIYDQNTGELFFDADGTGSGGQIKFAQLHAGLPITSFDFFVI